MQAFRRKSKDVEAARFASLEEGDGAPDAIRRELGEAVVGGHGPDFLTVRNADMTDVTVHNGEWLVKDAVTGRFSVCTDEEFTAQYEAV